MTDSAPTRENPTLQWERSILELRETLQGTEFRHKLPFVPVSSIAGQYYCELKVEHEYTLGEISTEAKDEGTNLHEQLLEMKETTLPNLINGLKNQPLIIASFLIGAKIEELKVAGLPDAMVFVNGRPTLLIELKTTRGELTLWKDQEVQAKMYALLLDAMGFDCSTLRIVVAKIRRSIELQPEQRKKFLASLIKTLLSDKEAQKQAEAALGGESKLFTLPYSREDVMKDLAWAKSYWLGSREPIPTNQSGKCRVCEFNDTCPASLA